MFRPTGPTARGATLSRAGGRLCAEELLVLRTMLEQQREFRLDQLAQLARPGPSGPLSSPDPEILGSLVHGARAALRDVQAALWRMDEGCYGSCELCAEAIPVERLEILPQTVRCLGCQRAATPPDQH